MNKKQKATLYRIIISILITAIIFIIDFNFQYAGYLYLIPYIIIGYDVLKKAFSNIVHGRIFDECFLMSIASLGAFFIGETLEAAAVMIFYQIGELFQSVAVSKSRKNIADLMDICPDTAVVVRNGVEEKIDADSVKKGDTVLVKPGETVPVDGKLLKGESSIDTSSLTGESVPVFVKKGDAVLSGSINLSGVIYVEAVSEFYDSTAAKIVELIENAGNKKAKAENFITSFAKIYTPAVVISAVLLAILPTVFTGNFQVHLSRALMFLVMSCPCALVISVPLTFFGSIGAAARKGILVKGSEYFEPVSKLKALVFDKTGTLTKGTFSVTAVHPSKISEDELMDIAALSESHSNHPIANSVVSAHKGHINKSRISSIKEIPGMGIEAVIDGRTIFAGNEKLMDDKGIVWKKCHHTGTIIHIAGTEEYYGHIVISDTVKPEAKEVLRTLRERFKINTVMLTGDNKEVAQSVQNKLGVDSCFSGLLPEDKVKITEELKGKYQTTGFVGDGINDAPVIRISDVGFAMGSLGSDAAIEAADIVITDDSLLKIPEAIAISKKAVKIARENIFFALFVKAAVLFLAAVGILEKTGAGMWVAVFADVGVMIAAIINAFRTLR